MPKAYYPPRKWRKLVFSLIALLIVIADQLSKEWVRVNLSPGQSAFETGFFRVIHAWNTGAAFGLFQGQSFILTIVALMGVAVILIYAFVIHRYFPLFESNLSWLGLGLIFGGTLGNLIDRFRLGYVTDFIDFSFWPAFNIADSAITIGGILFAYAALCLAQAEKR